MNMVLNYDFKIPKQQEMILILNHFKQILYDAACSKVDYDRKSVV